MDLITFGLDHIRFTEGFMIHLILSGDITTPFILDMDTDMAIHMDIVPGGDHTTIGTIIIHMAEI